MKSWTVYSKAGCIFCDAAMELLKEKEILYTEIKVENDDDAKRVFKMNSFKTVPQIFTDKDVYVGGYESLKNYFHKETFDYDTYGHGA
tara:strand:+ start:249 stop:512 length:264 start_codon:yes stop_codon:yes gene_type:complete